MVADVWNFHLSGGIGVSPFKTYNGASLSDGVSYNPRVGAIQESTPSLIIRVALHHVSNDFPEYILHRYVRFHEQSGRSAYLGPSCQVVLSIQQFIVDSYRA